MRDTHKDKAHPKPKGGGMPAFEAQHWERDLSDTMVADGKYSSEMNIQTAQNKVISANKFAQAKAAIEAQSHLDADIAIKLAFADALKNGKLQVPSTIAGGNFSLLELYGLTSMSNTSKTKR